MDHRSPISAPRYRAITRKNLASIPQWDALSEEQRKALQVVSTVLPFKTNRYVCDELIDWSNIPDDPIFQLTFVQKDMLSQAHYDRMAKLIDQGADKAELKTAADAIRRQLNPHPAGQKSHNVPRYAGKPLSGVQHKYRETVLFFPSQGQTCHAYCTFCFRWAQFVALDDLKFEAREHEGLLGYLRTQDEVSDVLITGGDPMVMTASALQRCIEPLCTPQLEHIRSIRIGTKSLSYWPYRFVTDKDSDQILRIFEKVIASGRHLSVMAHFNHPVELATPAVRRAIARIRQTGAEVRIQSPLVRRINDSAKVWADLWREGVALGCVPYYMFVERDTGPRAYFEVPLARAYHIYTDAIRSVSGLARTARGPSMSAFPGKIVVRGEAVIRGEKVFVLEFLQARNPEWVGRPFFAEYDPQATWINQLRPAFGEREFFFGASEEGQEVSPRAESLIPASRLKVPERLLSELA